MRKRLLGLTAILAFVFGTARVLDDLHVPWMPGAPGALPPAVALKHPSFPKAQKRQRRKRRRQRQTRRRQTPKVRTIAKMRDALAAKPPAYATFWDAAFKRPVTSAVKTRRGSIRVKKTRTQRSTTRRRRAPRRSRARRELKSLAHKPVLPSLVQTGTSRRRRSSTRRTQGVRRARGRPANGGSGVNFDGSFTKSSLRSSSSSGLRIPSLKIRRSKPPAKKKDAKPPKFKPPKLSDYLGAKPLKPPTGKLTAPSFSGFKELFPEQLPNNKPYTRRTPAPRKIERLGTPSEDPLYEKWLDKDAHRTDAGRPKDKAHWHESAPNRFVFHAGKAWARAQQGQWAWMAKKGSKWWTVGNGAQRMVRHQEHWWWRKDGTWYLLHQGKPWAWRHFAKWRRDGFIQPGSGVKMIYSADGSRIALVAADGTWRVFDARNGRIIKR
jgi:hypothetical protein